MSLRDVAIGSSARTVPVEVVQLSPEDQAEHNKELRIEKLATFKKCAPTACSNWKPGHFVRCRTLRSSHSTSSVSVSVCTSSSRLGVSNTQFRIALHSADISSAAQRVSSSTMRCDEHCDIIFEQVGKNVWIRMYKSVSSSMPTSQDCAVILCSSSAHTSWTWEFCISRCGCSSKRCAKTSARREQN